MSLRTLKFGDRTISYDAGLDSFGEHQPPSLVAEAEEALDRRRLSVSGVEHHLRRQRSHSNRSSTGGGAVTPEGNTEDSTNGGGGECLLPKG